MDQRNNGEGAKKRMRLRKNRIARLTEGLLRQCDVKKPPVPVKRIAKLLGLELKIEPPLEGRGEISGILIREEKKAIIGINKEHAITRQRFTIAHEIGHYLLHEGNRIFVDRGYRVGNLRDSVSSEGTNLEEIEANTFASRLLIPEHFLANDLEGKSIDIEDPGAIEKIKALAKKYNVSPQAMSFRILNRLQYQ